MALPERSGISAERELRLGAAHGHRRIGVDPQREPAERDLERRGGDVVAREQVGRPQREVIHRPGREEPLRQHPQPAGVVLHRRLDAALEDLGCSAPHAASYGTGVSAAARSRTARRSAVSSAMASLKVMNAPTSKAPSSTR